MRSEYDFSDAKRAKDIPHLARLSVGKTRITKSITVRELREHPERYPDIMRAAELFKPLVTRFLVAKKEAEQAFENLRGADMDEAVAYCRAHPLSPEAVAALIFVAHRAPMLEQVKTAASSRLANYPKQAVMREVFKLWNEWRTGKTVHKSAAAFARHVIGKHPIIESPMTVQRWVTKWSREATTK